jgi:hypothetical protein
VTEALDGVATVTPHSGKKRQKFLDQLEADLAEHHGAASAMVEHELGKIGLAGDFQHAVPLIGQAEERHREKIRDFGEGWTAPTAKPFKERHPYLYDSLLLLLGAAIGNLSQPLTNRLIGLERGAPAKQSAPVAPEVAPAKKPVPPPVKKLG